MWRYIKINTLPLQYYLSWHILCKLLSEICSDGTIRIAGGSTSLAGVVEVCINARWGTICKNDWNNTTALVVCRQLGHQNGLHHNVFNLWCVKIVYNNYIGVIADQSQFSAITRLVQLSEVSCRGNETSIYECSYSTSSSATCSGVAAIVCQGMYIISTSKVTPLLSNFVCRCGKQYH